MVCAKSSVVSSRSPFLPRYAASLLSRPSVKSASRAVSSALSSRPSCSVAEYTSGLADVDVPMFLSRPRLDFADLSSPCFVPACDSAPPVSSVPPVRAVPAPHVSSVGVPPVRAVSAPPVSVFPAPPVDSVAVPPVCSAVSVAVPPVRSSSALPAQSSSVTAPFSSFFAPSSAVTASPGFGRPVSFAALRPVYVPPVVAPSSSVAAPPGFRPAFVSPSPVGSVPSPVRSVPNCSVGSFAQPLCSAFVQPRGALPFCRPSLPFACLVLAVVPVLLSTPFGFVLSFLPVLRWGCLFCCPALCLASFVGVWSRFVLSHIGGEPIVIGWVCWQVSFVVTFRRCLGTVFVSPVVLQSISVRASFCLFACCMFVGAGFDSPVSLTCWCTRLRWSVVVWRVSL